jgi:hypothetical protein
LKAITEKNEIENEKKRLSEGSGEESKAKKKWFSKDKSIVDPQSYETFVKQVNDNNNEGMKTLTKTLDNLSKEVTNVMKQTKDIETIKKDMGSLQKNVDGVYKKIDEQDVKREKYHDQKNKLEEKKLEQQKLKEERDHEKSMRKTDQDAERDKIKLEKDEAKRLKMEEKLDQKIKKDEENEVKKQEKEEAQKIRAEDNEQERLRNQDEIKLKKMQKDEEAQRKAEGKSLYNLPEDLPDNLEKKLESIYSGIKNAQTLLMEESMKMNKLQNTVESLPQTLGARTVQNVEPNEITATGLTEDAKVNISSQLNSIIEQISTQIEDKNKETENNLEKIIKDK